MLLFFIFPLTRRSFICDLLKFLDKLVRAISSLFPDSFLLILQIMLFFSNMDQKLLKFIVIFLGVLIIISFIAIIYGSYSKLNKSNANLKKEISLDLKYNEEIIDLSIIDKNNILIKIKENNELKGIIYNTKTNKIITVISK